MGSIRGESKAQQEGVKGCSGSLSSANGKPDQLDLPPYEAIQSGLVWGRSDILDVVLLKVLGNFF